MRDAISKKIEDLGREVQALVQEREHFLNKVEQIEVRLHQITGAITELSGLIRPEKDEALLPETQQKP